MTRPQISMQLRTFTEDPGHDWDSTLALGRAMDVAGVDRVVVSDHVVFGENPDAYADPRLGGIVGGRQPTGPDGQWLDPLIVLTALAATTTRIRLGTAVLLAALRRPAVLAKQLATLDVLSGGRLDLGVGVGWQREEYEAAGLAFERRGRLLDHTLEVCQTLWTHQRSSYTSPELSFENIHQMPKPVQPGGVPIWVSGTVNDAVARRLARFGSGWIPWGPAIQDPAGAIAAMKDRIAGLGGDPTGLQVLGHAKTVKRADGSVDTAATAASAPALVAAGVTDVRVTCSLPRDAGRATELLSELVEAFRAATD
ncbi:TIGR03619 family F420-dependent LLM class oxidoreductase [Mycolicibacter terrae]|uniref:LLM class F420-dependent oxidoreductase n=2 Tax=Mycolicibacter TaxID=1073531 RepID=A0A1A2XZ94_MYCSD|nr:MULTISPECIES: TIGR03619 family F420-dependent LLM class oxidoreductase [Mycolicibacter]OBH17863.1 LLM class F420-dependent oxidoreductase [Mycolicibacter sinensis]OBI30211.1 LLM class F420-dependent oxidoreductase [Mycolicibacter sinensis]RRR47134.1 TIGR03619 family F420-dependent LLM class oxidoreductase [Mycolicibacter terrae]